MSRGWRCGGGGSPLRITNPFPLSSHNSPQYRVTAMDRPPASLVAVVGAFLLGALSTGPVGSSGPGQPPPGQPNLEAVCRAAGYVSVPLRRGKETDWWYVEVNVNDKSMRLMVDTGASGSTLLPGAAERIGYKPSGNPTTAKMAEHGPTLDYYRTIWPSVELAGLKTSAAPFWLMDMRRFNESVGEDGPSACDGILGASYLHAHSAVLDYPASKLYLLDPLVKEKELQGTWVCTAYETSTEVRTDRGLRVVRVAIQGGTVRFHGPAGGLEYRLALDSSASPRRMDWVPAQGAVLPCIYKLDGRRLTICGPLVGSRKPANRPSSFRSNTDEGVVILTFEKDS